MKEIAQHIQMKEKDIMSYFLNVKNNVFYSQIILRLKDKILVKTNTNNTNNFKKVLSSVLKCI